MPLLARLCLCIELFLTVRDLDLEALEGGVGRIQGKVTGAGIQGFWEFVQREAGKGGTVVGFDIGGVEAEGGGAVGDAGAVVF